MRTVLISMFAALIVIATAGVWAHAQGERSAAAAAAAFDAGLPPDAGIDAVTVAPSQADHVDPIADPAGAWQEFQSARKTGGLQIALGVLVAVIAGSVRRRLQPVPGQPEPDPESWRARSIALLGAAAMVAWGVADRAAGATSWIGLATIAVAAGALVWRAVDPPRGSAKKTTTATA